MSDDPRPADAAPPPLEAPPRESPSLAQLLKELTALRVAQHDQQALIEQALTLTRDDLKSSYNAFAAETHRAYQQLRRELHADKRLSHALLNDLLDVGHELEQIVAVRPAPDDCAAVGRWMETIAVESRRVQDLLRRHGVHPYDAAVGDAYNPALHERVGSAHIDGLEPSRVAEQRERGHASQQPEFVLRRPRVIVSE